MPQEMHLTHQDPGSHPAVQTLLDHTGLKVPGSASRCERNGTCRDHTSFRDVMAVLPDMGGFQETALCALCSSPLEGASNATCKGPQGLE